MTTLTEQLAAERRERAQAVNEPLRRELDPNRFRSDADRARLAAADAARIAAEQALNDARRASLAAEKAIETLSQGDGASLFFRDLAPARMTPAARAFVERGRAAQDAIAAAREGLHEAISAHNAVIREVDAVSAARRRQMKLELGQLPKEAA